MLVLTRKKNQSFTIGDDGPDQIWIVIVETHANHARIGIDAPRHIPILRSDAIVKVRKAVQSAVDRSKMTIKEAVINFLQSHPLSDTSLIADSLKLGDETVNHILHGDATLFHKEDQDDWPSLKWRVTQ